MRSRKCLVVCVVLLVGAGPATRPAQPTDADLKDPAYWLRRAEGEWRQIADPLQKPWANLARQQIAAGDADGLKRTLAELKQHKPSPSAKGEDYAGDRVAMLYSECAEYFARAGDEEGVKRVIAIANDRSRIKGHPRPYALDTLCATAAVSLARGSRDDEAIALANAIVEEQSRLMALIDIAREASKGGRPEGAQKTFTAARRTAAAERDKKKASWRRARIADALCNVGQLKEAAELAPSLSEADRASLEAQLASSYHRAGNQPEAKRHAAAALDLTKKVKWLGGLPANRVAQELARAGEPSAVDELRRLATAARSAPQTASELSAPSVAPPGTVMLTSGQSFAIDVHSGLALGFAAAQQAGPAREELKQAEAVIQAVDPKPLAPNWYVNLHQPVLFALAPRDAADLVNELLKRDIKDQQIRSNLVRVAAEKLSSAGNDAEAAPLWRELGYSSAPLYSVTSASLRPELERIEVQSDPRSRCWRYLSVVGLLVSAQTPTTSPVLR